MRSRALRKKHTPVDKSVLAVPANSRWEDPAYLKAMHDMECCVTGYRMTEYSSQGVDPAHIRSGLFGGGRKPDDFLCLPLAHSEHEKQGANEPLYWTTVANEKPWLLMEMVKSYAVLRYLKHKMDVATDRQLVAAIAEMME